MRSASLRFQRKSFIFLSLEFIKVLPSPSVQAPNIQDTGWNETRTLPTEWKGLLS